MRDKIVFLDTETTGLDHRRHDVWEIGLIVPTRQDNGEWLDEEFEFHVRPDLFNADPEALKINRFYDRTPPWSDDSGFWQDRKYVAESIARLTSGRSIVGANPSFDQDFLRDLLWSLGLTPAWHYRLICIESVVYGWFARGQKDSGGWLPDRFPWKSRDLTQLIGVAQPAEVAHAALADCRWVRDCWDATVTQATIEAQYG